MNGNGRAAADLTHTVLMVLVILGLTLGVVWILRPFLTALIGAATIAISTWPMLIGLQRRLGGRRGAAIACLLLLLASALVAPLCFGAIATAQGLGALSAFIRELPGKSLPALPPWVAGIPGLGSRAAHAWNEVTAAGGEGLRARLSEHSLEVVQWLLGRLGDLASLLGSAAVTLGITGIFYARGEEISAAVLRFARRLGGPSGEQAARHAALATRGVGLGVVLTPFIQSILAGVGMAVAGVPHVGLFALAVLISCLAQAGPIPAVVLPAIWLFARGSTIAAIALLAWAVVVHLSGPVVRPILIRRGVDLPMAIILSGVIGGVVAFGAVGLFIGPVLLAVATTLLQTWMGEDGEDVAGAAGTR